MHSQPVAGLLRAVLVAFATLYFLFSLLAVLKAPTGTTWKLAILATEWGYWVALVGIALSFAFRSHRVAAIILALGAVLLLTPIARALAFGVDPVELIAGTRVGSVEPVARKYTAVQRMDIYKLPAKRPLPAVIVIHGGSWSSGDEKQLPKLNSYLARHGYAVAAISYRLSPEHQFPAALQDVRAAITYLKSRSRELGIDSSRIALLGRSAGGQLALLAAYTARDPAIKGAISFYGPTDLLWGWQNPANPRVIDSRATLETYLGGPPAQRARIYSDASPTSYAASAVPTLLLHGARDELVSPQHAYRMRDRLRHEGVAAEFVMLPWATHGCDFAFNGPCGQISTRAVERFLARVFAEVVR